MLRVEEISVRFGGVHALDQLTLGVGAGTITGLIGPNGAGKTTLFNVINGLQRPNHGRVLLADRDITGLSPARRARRGLARTFQRLEVFGSMTARENIQVAAELHRRWARGAPEPRAATAEILERLGISAVADVQADTLPTGIARLVELGRAIATEPSVLLLDEPGSGLDTAETHDLGDVLLSLTASGIGVLLVEHDMELAMRVSKELYVLEFGRVIATGRPADIQADPAVRLAYLGAEAHVEGRRATALDAAVPDDMLPDDVAQVIVGGSDEHTDVPRIVVNATARADDGDAPDPTASPAGTDGEGAPILELTGIKAGYGEIEILHGVDIVVPRGTVFALLGANGAGKSTTLKVASGRLRSSAGTVRLAGQDVTRWHPERLTRAGLCTIPEGRGVFPNLTVVENLQMWTYRGGLRRREIEERAYAKFPILSQRRKQVAGTLSGGEQQMLAMSRALSTEPKLLLLDEISMGLAPLIVAELYAVVANLAAGGLTILVVEQSARTALDVADRAAVMANGRIALAGTPDVIADSVLDIYLAGGPA
ncbi:MAG TPA: ATP-binding cassette domain-containing protein [Acidimicrobiia bacterium]|nr:ATP-binding cassette domain-containing protein [Acidimicrobiia bacterium]